MADPHQRKNRWTNTAARTRGAASRPVALYVALRASGSTAQPIVPQVPDSLVV